jgi:hypothetical protein
MSSLGLQASVLAGLNDDGIYIEKFEKDVFTQEKEDIKWGMSSFSKKENLIFSLNGQLEIQYSKEGWSYPYFDIDASENDQTIEGTIQLETTDPARIIVHALKEDGKSEGPKAFSDITKNKAADFHFDKNDKEVKIQFLKNPKTKYRVYIYPKKLEQTGQTIVHEVKLEINLKKIRAPEDIQALILLEEHQNKDGFYRNMKAVYDFMFLSKAHYEIAQKHVKKIDL